MNKTSSKEVNHGELSDMDALEIAIKNVSERNKIEPIPRSEQIKHLNEKYGRGNWHIMSREELMVALTGGFYY